MKLSTKSLAATIVVSLSASQPTLAGPVAVGLCYSACNAGTNVSLNSSKLDLWSFSRIRNVLCGRWLHCWNIYYWVWTTGCIICLLSCSRSVYGCLHPSACRTDPLIKM